MNYRIVFFRAIGVSVSRWIEARLFEEVCEMARAAAERWKVEDDRFDGIITTEYKIGALGTFIGVVFHAEIDTGNRAGKLDFLVNDDDLEWMVNHAPVSAIRLSAPFFGGRLDPSLN